MSAPPVLRRRLLCPGDGYELNSTIYPVKDLKFTNDTPAHMLIQTFVEATRPISTFGSSDGRQVRLENYWRAIIAEPAARLTHHHSPARSLEQIECYVGLMPTGQNNIGDGETSKNLASTTPL